MTAPGRAVERHGLVCSGWTFKGGSKIFRSNIPALETGNWDIGPHGGAWNFDAGGPAYDLVGGVLAFVDADRAVTHSGDV